MKPPRRNKPPYPAARKGPHGRKAPKPPQGGVPRDSKAAPPTAWGEVAQWYDQLVGQEGSEYHQKVVFPGVLRLLGPCQGRRVLDVACGQGALCRLLRQHEAEVTGVDAAAEMIRLAGQRSDGTIHYHVADAGNLDFLGQGSFDAATVVLAIQNIHPLGPVFAALADCLREGGRLVMVMVHPCFRGPKATAWGWDEIRRVQYRRVERYLLPRKEPIVTHPGSDPGRYTWTFHRPIQSYVKALSRSGLLVDAMEEWASHKVSESCGRGAAENAARKEIPLFLAIRAVKLSAAANDAGDADEI